MHHLIGHRIHSSELITACTDARIRALEQDLSPQSISGGTYRSQVGTEHAHRAAGGVVCCSSGCKGQECVHARDLLNKFAAELLSLDSGVGLLLQKDHRPTTEVSLPAVSRQNSVSVATDGLYKACFAADPDASVTQP